jgi:hypothetical protein
VNLPAVLQEFIPSVLANSMLLVMAGTMRRFLRNEQVCSWKKNEKLLSQKKLESKPMTTNGGPT